MKTVLRAVALVSIVLAMVTVRVLWQSRAEWKAAESSQADQRILHLGRAARAYTPGNPWARRAREVLADLGRSSKPEALAGRGGIGRLPAGRGLRSKGPACGRCFFGDMTRLDREPRGRDKAQSYSLC